MIVDCPGGVRWVSMGGGWGAVGCPWNACRLSVAYRWGVGGGSVGLHGVYVGCPWGDWFSMGCPRIVRKLSVGGPLVSCVMFIVCPWIALDV